MKCPKCGNVVEAGYKFCTNCGTAISEKNEAKTNTLEEKQSEVVPESLNKEKQSEVVPESLNKEKQSEVVPESLNKEKQSEVVSEPLNKEKQSEVTLESAKEQKQSQSTPTTKQTAEKQKSTGKAADQRQTTATAKKSNKIIMSFIAIGAIVAVVIAIIALHKPTINLNNYLESNVELSGYEGAGTVSVALDTDSIVYDYADKIKVGKQAASMMDDDWGFTKDELLEMALDDYVDGSFDKSTDLSNGDKVTYKWNISKSAAKNFEKTFKCKLKYEDFTYKVSGLEEIPSVDPFDENDFEITFSGTAPDGSASVSNSTNSAINYSVNPSSGLSNGDKVTVTASLYDYSEADFVLSQTEKTFEVSGLDSYVTDISQISEDYIQKLDAQGKDAIDSMSSQDISYGGPGVKTREYVGAYLASAKSEESYQQNELFMIYKLTSNNGTSDIEYYFYVNFHNVIEYSDGTLYTDIMDYNVPEKSWWTDDESFSSGDNTFAGYETLDKLYNQKIVSLKAEYNITDNMNN